MIDLPLLSLLFTLALSLSWRNCSCPASCPNKTNRSARLSSSTLESSNYLPLPAVVAFSLSSQTGIGQKDVFEKPERSTTVVPVVTDSSLDSNFQNPPLGLRTVQYCTVHLQRTIKAPSNVHRWILPPDGQNQELIYISIPPLSIYPVPISIPISIFKNTTT
jgi:hypothetical protein